MFTNDRNKLREFYRESWRKQREGLPMEALEMQVADIVTMHPEYHAMLEQPLTGLDQDYTPEGGQENPFLHMGLHLALREQLATNRPAAAKEVYQALLPRLGEPHATEHRMIECLAEALFNAQNSGGQPDEQAYALSLRRLLSK